MPRLNPRQLARVGYDILTDVEWVIANVQHVANRANSDVDDCLTRTSGGHRNGGDTLTQPERYADTRLTNPDLIAAHMNELVRLFNQTRTTARAVRHIAGVLTISRDDRDREAQRLIATAVHRIGAGPCANCNSSVPGIASDRLRAGRCEPCYRYWKTHGNERPRQLWG